MSKLRRGGMFGWSAKTDSKRKSQAPLQRRVRFECLEQRWLLSSVGLGTISTVTLPAGTSTLVALNGSDPGQTVHFDVTTSDPTKVSPLVMPQTNKSVQFNINGLGTMTFQLFDNLAPNTSNRIETLVNDNFYNGDFIYRAQSGFVVQGGNQVPVLSNGAVSSTNTINTLPSGVPATIPEEFNSDLNYTSAGTLAMARTSAPDSSATEFFIGEGPTRNLDYSYTLFGFQTVDQAITVNGQSTTVLKDIEAQPTESTTGFSYLTTPIKINSASIITDTQNGVLMLKAPTGVTGSFTVTVTAYDSTTNTPTTKTFTVNVVADTATSKVVNPWASKTPTAPTSVVFQPQPGQGLSTITTANNSSASKELQFLVSGVTSGNLVTVYADGVAIGTATATSNTVTVTTNGTMSLLDGTHSFTATQSVSAAATYTDSGGSSRTETTNVASYSSPADQLQVFNSLITATIPTNASLGGNVTVSFSGNQYQIFDNIAKTILKTSTFSSTDAIAVDSPAGQTNLVTVVLPATASAAHPEEVLVQGDTGSTNNQVTIQGTSGANTFTLAGGTVTANGLPTAIATVQKLTLQGGAGSDTYALNSSTTPVAIVDAGGNNSLDFSKDTAGVAVNLGLDHGQAQAIVPWSTTLAINGIINKLTGTAFADTLTGGHAATTIIRSGTGNDKITGGSGDSILVGGGGNDTLTGGSGRNLLIAGSGTSSLTAKGTSNIIFAGSTSADANDQALMILLQDKVGMSYGYSARRLLASSAKQTATASSPVTFLDSGAHDTIFGGSLINWFVLGKNGIFKR